VARDAAVALGFTVHSGWAAVVALGVSEGVPYVAARERIEMAEPSQPESRQPFHTVEGLPVEAAAKRLATYRAQAERMASEQIQAIVGRLRAVRQQVVGVGLLESSGCKGFPLASILASHALIHSADGDHFRDAIAVAADGLGRRVVRVASRAVTTDAANALGMTPAGLQARIQQLGREVGPPWAADQKAAAAVAWLVVARQAERGRRTRG
jgi:hypothetical protein